MTAAPLHIAGHRLMLDPAGGLVWPEAGVLAIADLHLEKATHFAARGQLVPPWDTRITLDRLALLIRRHAPKTVVALGDSFHDARGAARLMPADAARLAALTQAAAFVWVLGNHDPRPQGLPGECADEWRHEGLVFRHQALARVPDAAAEISGHFHPKATVPARAGSITRPCFVADPVRVMLPAFGAFTGGLDVRAPAIAALFPRGGRTFLLGRDRLFSFALPQVRGMAVERGVSA
jgi:DNA ligase-associated metallophosphoesterase